MNLFAFLAFVCAAVLGFLQAFGVDGGEDFHLGWGAVGVLALGFVLLHVPPFTTNRGG